MIRDATLADKQEIYKIWKNAYPGKENRSLDYFFNYLYDRGKVILCEQDGRIVSALQYHSHVMEFNNRRLSVSYLHGVVTIPDYRMRGHMRKLMEATLDEVSHNHLISVIEAFNPKVYEQFGFESIYFQKYYTISSRHLLKINLNGVSIDTSKDELLYVYDQYKKHFDGYLKRDRKYFDLLLQRSKIEGNGICVYRNKLHKIEGYAFYEMVNREVVVKEIIYVDSLALMKMLKYMIKDEDHINVYVSQSEQLEKIFPLIIAKKLAYMMVRINNYELFNKLYNVEVKNVKEAYNLLKKPLFLHEFY